LFTGILQIRSIVKEEVKKVTLDLEERAREVSERHRDPRDAFTTALLERETLNRDDMGALLKTSHAAN
jgi:ATP-dependent Zn protease